MRLRIIIVNLLLNCIFALSADASPADTIFSFLGAQQADDGVLISFTIKGGVTCQGVQIKHSTDGNTFSEIHEFAGVCGSPSFDESYYFTHGSPKENSINYYRIDLGSIGLTSSVIKVEYIGYNSEGYHIFPNPVSESSNIYFTNPGHTLHQYVVVSSRGDIVFTGETTEDRINISGRDLSAGVYRFIVYRLSERRFSGQFVRIN